jgi:hypothetical protein
VVLAFGRAVLFSSFSRRFSPGRAKIVEKKEVKYLAVAGTAALVVVSRLHRRAEHAIDLPADVSWHAMCFNTTTEKR